MPIQNLQNINIGQPNQPANSDSLYTAFTTIQDNFQKIANEASPVSTFNAGAGIGITTTGSNTITINNQGVTSLTAGTGIILSGATGAVTISSTGGGGGGGGTVTSVGVTSPNSTLTVTSTTSNPIIGAGTFNLDLATIPGLTPATYVNPNVTVDSRGRVTSITNGVVSGINNIITVANAANGVTATSSIAGGVATITIDGTGVTGLNAGAGITLSGNTGNVTITATGGGGGGGSGSVTGVGLKSNTFTTGPIQAGAILANTTQIVNNGFLGVELPAGWTWNKTTNNMTVANNISAANNVSATTLTGNLTTASQPNITTVGPLTSLTVVGSLTANTTTLANLTVTTDLSAGNSITTQKLFSATGNFTGNVSVGNLIGNVTGSQLLITNMNASNLTSGVIPSAAVNGAYGNINAVGTLAFLNVSSNGTSNGNIIASGTLSAANLITSANATIGNVLTANIANANLINVANNLSVSNSISVTTGNITVTTGNIVLAGNIYANTGNIFANAGNIDGNIVNANRINVNGANINLYANGLLTASAANIFNDIHANGSLFVNDNVSANVATIALSANIQGNLTVGGLTTFTNTTDATAGAAAVTLNGGALINKKLLARGDVTIGTQGTPSAPVGNLLVQGTANFTSSVFMNANLDQTGNHANFGGNVYVPLSLSVGQDLLTNTLTANIDIAALSGFIIGNLESNLVTSNLSSTVTTTSTNTVGNLISIKINGTTYQLLAR